MAPLTKRTTPSVQFKRTIRLHKSKHAENELTCSAHINDLKANVFPFTITICPDNQRLALPYFALQSPLQKQQGNIQNVDKQSQLIDFPFSEASRITISLKKQLSIAHETMIKNFLIFSSCLCQQLYSSGMFLLLFQYIFLLRQYQLATTVFTVEDTVIETNKQNHLFIFLKFNTCLLLMSSFRSSSWLYRLFFHKRFVA